MTKTSVEIVNIINEFRKNDGRKELQHKSFMAKIRKESEVLGDKNTYFIETSYINKQNKEQPCFSLNRDGIKHILDMTKSKDRVALQKIYEDMGGDYSTIICIDRFETTFFNKLKDTLCAMNINLDMQKTVLSYRLDGYLPQYNLAIEYDEAQHFVEPQKSKDIRRQKEIKKELGCEFVRLNYKDTDAYNIGLVMKKIFDIGQALQVK